MERGKIQSENEEKAIKDNKNMSRRTIIWLILTIITFVFTIYTMIKILGLNEGVLSGIFTLVFFIPTTLYCLFVAKENNEDFDGELNFEPSIKLFIIIEMLISIGLWCCKLSNNLII